MSNDFNLIGTFKPKVENTFLNKGGGGGNTGYFSQGRKKKNEQNSSIMTQKDDGDLIEKFVSSNVSSIEDNPDFMDKIKCFLGKIR